MVILDFCIQSESSSSYRLEIFARDNSQSLATAQFDLPLSFLTGYELSGLELDRKDPAARVERLKAYGGKLYQKLFASEDMRRVWEEHKTSAEFLTLCLRTAPDAVALEALPWEALYDGKEFIAAGVNTGVSRLPLDIAPSADLPAVPLPVRMLALVASPLDLPEISRLQIEREQEILLEAVNTPAGQGKLFVDFEDEAKLDILEHSLEAGYHIFHFTGHGIPPEAGGGLLLEDAAGKRRPTSVSEMIAALQKGAATLRLVVLLGCQTARTLHTGGFSDLARGLARGLQGMPKIPAVLAMQFSISDSGGLMLAEKLYPRLIEGQPLEIAVSRTRRDLLLSDDPYLQGDAIAPVLLVSNGRCLQSRAADLPDAPQLIEPDFSFHLPLAQHSFGFYGRRREYRQLRDGLLQRNQRAVIIYGIGGIGKTALVSHAASRLRNRFRGIYAFDCGGGMLAPERVIAELHRYFELQGIHALQRLAFQPLPPEVLANYLAQVLAQWPLLVIFDNFETQLERAGDDFRIADEALRIFLITLVKATATGSRFLFTSRYLFDLDDKRLGNIQSLPLGDLSRVEALMLMQRLPKLAEVSYWEKLQVYKTFGGHAYAMVAVDRFCQHYPVNDALQAVRIVQSELREFLAIEINYARLSDDARELLNRFAAFRRPEPIEAAEWVMEETGRRNRAITELIEWGLLTPQMEEERSKALHVHNLVRDFCCEQQAGEPWRSRLRDAAVYYTNQTKLTEQDDKSQAAVWGEMEAFELLMEADDYDDAAVLLSKAHQILRRWGYDRYLENQYRRLLVKLDQHGKAIARLHLGELSESCGDYKAAMDQAELSFKILDELGDRAGAARSLHNIARLHYLRGDYDVALQQSQRSLEIAGEVNDRDGIALSFHQIGMIYQVREDFDVALQCYQISLKTHEELGDRMNVAISLHQIGMIHQARGNYDEALQQFQLLLEINKELGDRKGIAVSHHQIGMIYHTRGNYVEALQQHHLSLKIAEELGNRVGVANSFHEIGMIYQARGDYKAALKHFHDSLNIKKDLKDLTGEVISLLNIGAIYQDIGDYEAALQHFHRSLEITEKIGDRIGVAGSHNNIGGIHQIRGDYDEALQHFNLSINISKKLGDHAGAARVLHNIGVTHHDLGEIHKERGDYDKALQHYQSSLDTFEELGDRAGAAPALHNIGGIHHRCGDYDEALRQYRRSLKLCEELGDRDGVANSLHNIGMIHQERGDNDAALRQYQPSLKIFEELSDRASIANSLHQIGIIHHDRGNYEMALRQYHRALEINEELGDRVGEARLLYQIAKLHHEHRNYEVALRQSQLSLKIFEELGDRAGVATSLSQIGIILGKSRRYTEAFQYFFLALNTYIELQSPDVKGAISNLRNLRAIWGAWAFDAAWRKATSEDSPEWLTQ